MMRFVALYAGPSLSEAKLVAITSSPTAVRAVAEGALAEGRTVPNDPVLGALEAGRRRALEKIVAKKVKC